MIDYFYVYFKDIFKSISKIDNNSLLDIANKITKANNDSGKIIIVGNGGSAAIASHVSIDLTKAANIRSINFNEASLLKLQICAVMHPTSSSQKKKRKKIYGILKLYFF